MNSSNPNATKELLVIVGAGAGVEINMPAGENLKSIISRLLDITIDDSNPTRTRLVRGDRIIMKTINELVDCKTSGFVENNPFDQSKRIAQALPLAPSIDEYLNIHRNDELIGALGKLAIVKSILDAERGSTLSLHKQAPGTCLNFNKLNGTWFNRFFQYIVRGNSIDELPTKLKKISFVIFNYDRCVEHFLYNAIRAIYDTDENQTVSILNQIEFIHPYGVVGSLPWQTNQDSVQFGIEPKPAHLVSLRDKIKTFTEGTNPDSSDINRIQLLVKNTRKTLILGFGFHELNLDLLQPQYTSQRLGDVRKEIFATTLNFSHNDVTHIRRRLVRLFNISEKFIFTQELNCLGLLQHYSKSFLK